MLHGLYNYRPVFVKFCWSQQGIIQNGWGDLAKYLLQLSHNKALHNRSNNLRDRSMIMHNAPAWTHCSLRDAAVFSNVQFSNILYWVISKAVYVKLSAIWQRLIGDKFTLVWFMALCRKATSHYLNQCWPRSVPSFGATRPQWVIDVAFVTINPRNTTRNEVSIEIWFSYFIRLVGSNLQERIE